jgi:hypothetical protein
MKLPFLLITFLHLHALPSQSSLFPSEDHRSIGHYTEIVIKYAKNKKIKDAVNILKSMPQREVISELIASSGHYAEIGGLQGAPFVSLIKTAQDLDGAIFKEEFVNFASKCVADKKFQVLLKCGFYHMYDLKYLDLELGDQVLTQFIGLNDESMKHALSIIVSKHTYSIYMVEQIRRLSSLQENKHYIYVLEGVKTNYLKSEYYNERTVEEVVDKCNRAIAHVEKLKKGASKNP